MLPNKYTCIALQAYYQVIYSKQVVVDHKLEHDKNVHLCYN